MPTKFSGEDQVRPSQSQAIDYLKALTGETRRDAEEYVRKAPAQIATPYRTAFEKTLGWTPN